MEYSMEERVKRIVEECKKIQEINPTNIFRKLVNMDFIRMHGPEHHILDGACILTAFYNVGGNVKLEEGLEQLVNEGMRMPGGTCGLWGVCGSVSSIGAALAIIDGTGPLTADESWGNHMKFTSKALEKMSEIGGPRCCKRNAFISLTEAADYINKYYAVKLPSLEIKCGYSKRNEQCIKERCPYYVEVN